MQIAISHNCQVAVLPCCQKDHSHRWKPFAKNLNIPVGAVIDIISAGKMIQAGYDVKIKLLDPNITPQNRLILCRYNQNEKKIRQRIQKNSERLDQAYRRAHAKINSSIDFHKPRKFVTRLVICTAAATAGFIAGIIFTRSSQVHRQRNTHR